MSWVQGQQSHLWPCVPWSCWVHRAEQTVIQGLDTFRGDGMEAWESTSPVTIHRGYSCMRGSMAPSGVKATCCVALALQTLALPSHDHHTSSTWLSCLCFYVPIFCTLSPSLPSPQGDNFMPRTRRGEQGRGREGGVRLREVLPTLSEMGALPSTTSGEHSLCDRISSLLPQIPASPGQFIS